MNLESTQLGINTFPSPVERLLSDNPLSKPTSELVTEIDSKFANQNLAQYEKNRLEDIIETAHSDLKESRFDLIKQSLGTICAFIHQREDKQLPPLTQLNPGGQKLKFKISPLSNNRNVYLQYPGDKAFNKDGSVDSDNVFDFQVHLEDYKESGRKKEMARHDDLFSDLFWKIKEAKVGGGNSSAVNEWAKVISDLEQGDTPTAILSEYRNLDDFTVGRNAEALVHTTYWILLQEDMNYPRSQNYDGRTQSLTRIQRLFELTADDFERDTVYRPRANSKDLQIFDSVFGDLPGDYEAELIGLDKLQNDPFRL